MLTCHKTQEVEDSLPGGQPQVTEDSVRVAELGVARLYPLALLGADVEDGLGLEQQEGLYPSLLYQHAVGLHLGLVPHADVATHCHGDNDNAMISEILFLMTASKCHHITSLVPCPRTSDDITLVNSLKSQGRGCGKPSAGGSGHCALPDKMAIDITTSPAAHMETQQNQRS